VAIRSVRTVTRLVPDLGRKSSSPTTEWSSATASTVQLAFDASEEIRTSMRAVTRCSSTTWNPISCESTFGVDSTYAAHASQPSATSATTTTAAIMTGRRHAGGAAYRSVRVCSTTSMLPPILPPMSQDPAGSPRPGSGLRLMHVHAHPDDESSKGAASTAKYVAEGVDVHVVTCTGGERGSILNPKMDRPEIAANMTEVRRQEMERARDILGIRQDWLGFVDSGWPEGDPKPPLPEGCFALVPLEECTERLVRFMRDFKPHVVTTYDEKGGYPHPDHIRCHEVSVAAFEAAGDPERFPDAGEPWQPLKLYYHHGWSYAKIKSIHDAMLAHGLESPYAERLEKWDRDEEWDKRLTTRVECSDYFGVRDQALLAHATQIDPDGFWFSIPRELQVSTWPTEDYELVISHVESSLPEDDLFAGIRGR
jgi:mycothiol S-conjugate amidase